ncbi:NAD(+) hydrolase sarm1 [Nephila pilipes]|uniref:NAD(+) hydrolase sarm1 n=1 Tax=Nephila pilipes TaxID=299642 RepID=A0A8X6NBG5_NEPPI|nr:NAD(+) hydrolase sarm1 [Nephila pilipes]
MISVTNLVGEHRGIVLNKSKHGNARCTDSEEAATENLDVSHITEDLMVFCSVDKRGILSWFSPPYALDRCINDTVTGLGHREIVEALKSQCNIIPILDNFQWPESETLPEDMRALSYFNGVRWIHDYQDACVDKIERFMRGELNVRADGNHHSTAWDGRLCHPRNTWFYTPMSASSQLPPKQQ